MTRAALRVGLWALSMSAATGLGVAACAPQDPLACAKPACSDKMKFFEMAKQAGQSSKSTASSSSSSTPLAGPSGATAAAAVVREEDCPLDRAETGRSTWNLLHTLAANYPEQPTEEQKQHARNLIAALAELYPCPVCAQDFRVSAATHPPQVDSRRALVLWLCRQHNEVNAKLGKPLFQCAAERLDLRWRKGAEGCWDYKQSIAQEREDMEAAQAAEDQEAAAGEQ